MVRDPCPGLRALDVSNNEAGFFSQRRIERANENRRSPITLDLEGNLVVQEVLNVITHGSGCIASIVGTPFLLKRAWRVGDEVQFKALFPACFVYCMSSIACYLSSSLYHSTFKLGAARHICHIADQVSFSAVV